MPKRSNIARTRIGAGAFAAVSVLALNKPAESKPVITSFDVPGSIGTAAHAIKSAGTISGFYGDSNHKAHSFIRSASIAGGKIAGWYEDSNHAVHGFVRQ